jgi:iron(II)-dependent oxidoreductase
MLLDARARTLDLVHDLEDGQLMGPRLAIINPFLWEIGHVAWFQENWVVRHYGGEALTRDDADSLYDSMKVAHDTRWDLPLPSRAETLAYMEAVLERVLARVTDPVDPKLAYFVQLIVFHEDMHDEAFTYTRQTLNYPAPRLRIDPTASDSSKNLAVRDTQAGAGPVAGDVEVPGGTLLLGADPEGQSFVFDNEKWGHPVAAEPFRIARAPVTNIEFAAFVENCGYEREDLWTKEGWAWRNQVEAHHPVYWRRADSGSWERREFDRWVPLGNHLPVIHVNWYEADAWCRWAGGRLPSEAEVEAVTCIGDDSIQPETAKRRFPWGDTAPTPEHANLDGLRLGVVEVGAFPSGGCSRGTRGLTGNVWEWTQTPFAPYPGFVPDPYKDYSAPWMDGKHMVLRGGAWPTRSRLLRNTWRNFYPRDRRDVFAGFRTCAR